LASGGEDDFDAEAETGAGLLAPPARAAGVTGLELPCDFADAPTAFPGGASLFAGTDGGDCYKISTKLIENSGNKKKEIDQRSRR
jgi:hypothetical protein